MMVESVAEPLVFFPALRNLLAGFVAQVVVGVENVFGFAYLGRFRVLGAACCEPRPERADGSGRDERERGDDSVRHGNLHTSRDACCAPIRRSSSRIWSGDLAVCLPVRASRYCTMSWFQRPCSAKLHRCCLERSFDLSSRSATTAIARKATTAIRSVTTL